VILHMLRIGMCQTYCDLFLVGLNVSKAKTELWHRLLTHYLPLYFRQTLAAYPKPSIPDVGHCPRRTWRAARRKRDLIEFAHSARLNCDEEAFSDHEDVETPIAGPGGVAPPIRTGCCSQVGAML
jgi:hypothetical protein